jgi:hypothetical protein
MKTDHIIVGSKVPLLLAPLTLRSSFLIITEDAITCHRLDNILSGSVASPMPLPKPNSGTHDGLES